MHYKTLLAVSFPILLSACGGGGSESATPPPQVTSPPPETGVTMTGIFVDSAVSGLNFRSDSESGTTNEQGEFSFKQGEDVSFYLGESLIGTTKGGSLITPLELFETTDLADTAVLNLARLLQTLDADGNPENGIAISEDAASVISSVAPDGLDYSQDDFSADEDLQSILAMMSISELVSVSQAHEHMSQSLSANYQAAQRALPIPGFNAYVTGVIYYSNVYTPVDESEEDAIIDTLGEGFGDPRYALPFATKPFYDFSQADKTDTGIGINESYVWVDDVLSDHPQLKMKLFGLDRSKLLEESLGLGVKLVGKRANDTEYKVTLIVDPDTWFATILVDDLILWDEVGVSGDYNSDANKTSLWLPLEALQLTYANLVSWQQVTVEFFLFDLENVSETNLAVTHYFPPIISSFEAPKVWKSDKVHLEFNASTERTEFPYDEYDTGCRFTTELTYSGDISWQETTLGMLLWPTNTTHFEGSLAYTQKPDNINYDGSTYPCQDNLHYSADNLFNMRKGQSQLTLHDVMKLFTPIYNETWYDNAQTLVPQNVISNPSGNIENISIDPVSQTIILNGQSSCSAILNCWSAEDDLFNWTMTLSPAN